MRLSDEEKAMLAGELGEPRQWAIKHQMRGRRIFRRRRISCRSRRRTSWPTRSRSASTASPFSKAWRATTRRRGASRVPTITDPRGVDFRIYKKLGQQQWMADLEARAIAAFEALGVLMTNTCINYQTIMPPVLGEHMAYGDTGVVIYSNSVLGARSNFEGGPSALAAALTGRTPRYGFHLDRNRRGTQRYRRGVRAARLDRLGRARRPDRAHGRKLLGGAGDRGHRNARPAPTRSSISAPPWRASARSACSIWWA